MHLLMLPTIKKYMKFGYNFKQGKSLSNLIGKFSERQTDSGEVTNRGMIGNFIRKFCRRGKETEDKKKRTPVGVLVW